MWSYYQTLLRASAHTLRYSVPFLVSSTRNRLTVAEADRHILAWSRALLADIEPRLTVLGHENLEPSGACIVMSNHQSLYDIPVLFASLGISMRMLAKIELFSIPVLGSAMRKAGFVPVDRKNRTRAIESIERARALLDSGVSVYIAPEGTRSRNGELLPFKKGGFVLAEKTGLPILPVSISGLGRILPAGSKALARGCEVRVVIHPRVSSQGLTRDELMARVRATIQGGV